MKKVTLMCLVIFSLSTFPAFIHAAGPSKQDDGIFENQTGSNLVYVVDTIAQQCFVRVRAQGGVTPILCEALAKRTEWKAIITWVEK